MKKNILLTLLLLFTNFIYANDTKLSLKDKFTTTLDIKEIFFASPVIYSVLLTLSVGAVAIWIYCIFSFRKDSNMSDKMKTDLKQYLLKKEFDKAQSYCNANNNLFASLIASGISARSNGPQFIVDSMKSEGQRFTTKFWQRMGLLNDIVIIAPMLGLLGTVIGMFYAFYDMNRSIDSIASLFDGLGIAIGTTVAGLVVAIIAMIFHATLKFRLVKTLNLVENEAFSLSSLIHSKVTRKKAL